MSSDPLNMYPLLHNPLMLRGLGVLLFAGVIGYTCLPLHRRGSRWAMPSAYLFGALILFGVGLAAVGKMRGMT